MKDLRYRLLSWILDPRLGPSVKWVVLCAPLLSFGHAVSLSLPLREDLTAGECFRLAPLYDVVSAQPSVDAGQIRHNQMRLAMAIGENRHYVVDTIMPRHFVQTGQVCGLPRQMVESVIEELSDTGSTKIDEVVRRLPDGFPEAVASAISGAAKHRLKLFYYRPLKRDDVRAERGTFSRSPSVSQAR